VFSDSLAKSAAGLKKYNGVKYQTTVQRITGLIPPGSTGINHSEWAKLRLCRRRFLIIWDIVIDISTDGVVVLLNVQIVP
jgi:hypothetical protein